MAKTYQIEAFGDVNQTTFDNVAHSFLFADSVVPVYSADTANPNTFQLIVTSNVESSPLSYNADAKILADDSRSEVSVDIATGKFVEGNIICGVAQLAEIQNDVRDFVTYTTSTTGYYWFVGVCATTQSQDYTPDIIANSRVIKMLTPAQVKSLNL